MNSVANLTPVTARMTLVATNTGAAAGAITGWASIGLADFTPPVCQRVGGEISDAARQSGDLPALGKCLHWHDAQALQLEHAIGALRLAVGYGGDHDAFASGSAW